MSLWKDFCRTLESDVVREHFGMLAEQIDYFAVFVLEDEQAQEAWEISLETEEDGPQSRLSPSRRCVWSTTRP